MPFFGRRVTKGSISIERSEARPRRNLGAIVASRSVASIIANPAPIAHAGPPQRANRQSGGGSHYESGSRSSGPGQIFPVHRRSGHPGELSMESTAHSCPHADDTHQLRELLTLKAFWTASKATQQ